MSMAARQPKACEKKYRRFAQISVRRSKSRAFCGLIRPAGPFGPLLCYLPPRLPLRVPSAVRCPFRLKQALFFLRAARRKNALPLATPYRQLS